MFAIGVATSIARNEDYSWEYTVDFCARHKLGLIQFYWQNPVPRIEKMKNLDIPWRYLHLPAQQDMATSSLPEISTGCRDFSGFYKSRKLVMHDRSGVGSNIDFKLIRQLNALNFDLGLENDFSSSLNGFQDGISICRDEQLRIFAVFDVHKFFHRFYRTHSSEQIVQAVADIFACCRKLNLALLLHVIDSNSFEAGREFWCPVFEGIVPYRQIFEHLLHAGPVSCAGIILEYEDEIMAGQSIKSLRKVIN